MTAQRYLWLWWIVLAMGTVVPGGCRLRPADVVIPPAPTTAVSRAESAPSPALRDELESVLEKMEAAYARVDDYRTEVEVTLFQKDGSSQTERSVYTYKRPKRIRIDTLAPHPGMVMIFPDPNGKVLVRPSGILSILSFHLTLDDPLLDTPSGQQMNQTDIGLLIENIRHSVTDWRRGPVSMSENADTVQIRVLAKDHFREGVETRYRYVISKALWLPVEVDESAANGMQEGRIVFHNLRINIGVPDDLFLEGK